MGREEIVRHIETELRSENNPNDPEHTKAFLCQHCGVPIDVDEQQTDYVIHRIPAHGESEMRSVFYCGPSCFQDAMDDLFEA